MSLNFSYKNFFDKHYIEFINMFMSFRNYNDNDNLCKTIVDKIFKNWESYLTISYITKVPASLIAILHYRESNFNFNCHLHDGSSIKDNEKIIETKYGNSKISCFKESAIDALSEINWRPTCNGYYKHFWSIFDFAYFMLCYNGFGYYYSKNSNIEKDNRPIHSPYLWSFTTYYDSGYYTKDGIYSPNISNKQVGGMLLLHELIKFKRKDISLMSLYSPMGLNVERTQHLLKDMGIFDLKIDGIYGVNTSRALRVFYEMFCDKSCYYEY